MSEETGSLLSALPQNRAEQFVTRARLVESDIAASPQRGVFVGLSPDKVSRIAAWIAAREIAHERKEQDARRGQ